MITFLWTIGVILWASILVWCYQQLGPEKFLESMQYGLWTYFLLEGMGII
jgi:hypothetical protein